VDDIATSGSTSVFFRMRPLLINNSADIYGASRSLLRLACRLQQLGHEPLVLLPESGPLDDHLQGAGIRTVIFPSLRVITRQVLFSWRLFPWLAGFLPSALQLARLIKHEQIDVVHTNTGVIVSSALAARFARRPHVWHIREWFQEFGPLWKPYSKYILAHSNRVLCVSGAIAAQFPASPKIEVLHNGFDLGEFPEPTLEERALARSRWNLPPERLVAGTVGRIKFKRKGQEFLLHAAKLLRDRGIDITCILAGGPAPGAEEHIDQMKQLAGQLGVTVAFTGELADARAAYAAMDIFILPSAQPEPFGGVIMEAMALGLPIVATSVGGPTEIVTEGETGFLVPPADSAAIAQAIAKLATAPDLRRHMGSNGRQRVAEKFNIRDMTTRIVTAYENLLHRHPTPS
jgi:glycosyltransferase involved in cell wall biosynthesis